MLQQLNYVARMAPLAFYDGLAASASVFIGILTALLISDLSSVKTERRRIARRIAAINARVESLASRQKRLEENMGQIEDVWDNRAQQDAKEDVEGFIDRHVGSDFIAPIENINQAVLKRELADHLGRDVDDLDQYHEDELQAQLSEIESELVPAIVDAIISDYEDMSHRRRANLEWEEVRDDFKAQLGIDSLDERTRRELGAEYNRITPDPDRESNGPFGELLDSFGPTSPLHDIDTDLGDISPAMPPEYHAARMQREDQQRIHEENQYHTDQNQRTRVVTEAEGLKTEREQLKSRFESLDPTDFQDALYVSVGTIVASVLFPLLIHLLHILGWVLQIPTTWTGVEPFVVFSIWVAGLLGVFWYLRGEVTDETIELPDEPSNS